MHARVGVVRSQRDRLREKLHCRIARPAVAGEQGHAYPCVGASIVAREHARVGGLCFLQLSCLVQTPRGGKLRGLRGLCCEPALVFAH